MSNFNQKKDITSSRKLYLTLLQYRDHNYIVTVSNIIHEPFYNTCGTNDHHHHRYQEVYRMEVPPLGYHSTSITTGIMKHLWCVASPQ